MEREEDGSKGGGTYQIVRTKQDRRTLGGRVIIRHSNFLAERHSFEDLGKTITSASIPPTSSSTSSFSFFEKSLVKFS
jgi:hypothetical protein